MVFGNLLEYFYQVQQNDNLKNKYLHIHLIVEIYCPSLFIT